MCASKYAASISASRKAEGVPPAGRIGIECEVLGIPQIQQAGQGLPYTLTAPKDQQGHPPRVLPNSPGTDASRSRFTASMLLVAAAAGGAAVGAEIAPPACCKSEAQEEHGGERSKHK